MKSWVESRGFTLIELLVVIAIISVLSSVVLASLNTAREKENDARRMSDIKQLANAFALTYSSTGYPNTGGVGRRLGTSGSCWGGATTGDAAINSAIQQSIPTDPKSTRGKGDRYIYVGPDPVVAAQCSGASTPTGPRIFWVPEDTEPTSLAECKNAHFHACRAAVSCGTGYYCAYQV